MFRGPCSFVSCPWIQQILHHACSAGQTASEWNGWGYLTPRCGNWQLLTGNGHPSVLCDFDPQFLAVEPESKSRVSKVDVFGFRQSLLTELFGPSFSLLQGVRPRLVKPLAGSSDTLNFGLTVQAV